MPSEPDEDGFRWYSDDEVMEIICKADQYGFDLTKNSKLELMSIGQLDRLVNRIN